MSESLTHIPLINELRTERDRLRAALEQIVALTPHGSSCPEHFTLLPGIFYIARTALASDKGGAHD